MANVGAKLFLWINLGKLSSVVKGLVTLRSTNTVSVVGVFVGCLGLKWTGLAALILAALNVLNGL